MKGVDIVLDVDGILLDYVEAFSIWVETEKGFSIDPDSDRSSYDMSSWFCNMTSEEFLALIKEYNHSPREIPSVKGSIEAILRLKSIGYTMSALTSFGGSVGSIAHRKATLNTLFPRCFTEVIALQLGKCKRDALKELKPRYFIDDYDYNLEVGLSLGITCIGLRTTYNGYTDAIYVDNWNGINYIICEKDNIGGKV